MRGQSLQASLYRNAALLGVYVCTYVCMHKGGHCVYGADTKYTLVWGHMYMALLGGQTSSVGLSSGL